MNNLIKKILVEWSYRLDDGIIDLENYKHLSILREVLSDMELSSEVIIEVMGNITEKEKESFSAIKKDTGNVSDFGSKQSRDAAIKAGTHTAVDKKDDETTSTDTSTDTQTDDSDIDNRIKTKQDTIRQQRLDGEGGAGGAKASYGESQVSEAHKLDIEDYRKKNRDTINKKKEEIKNRKSFPTKADERTADALGLDPNSEEFLEYLATREVWVEQQRELHKKEKIYKKFGSDSAMDAWNRAAFDGGYMLQKHLKKSGMKNANIVQSTTELDDDVQSKIQKKKDNACKKPKSEDCEYYTKELEDFKKYRKYHDTYAIGEDENGRMMIIHISNKKSDKADDGQANTTTAQRLQRMKEKYGKDIAESVVKALDDGRRKAQSIKPTTVKNIEKVEVDDDFVEMSELADTNGKNFNKIDEKGKESCKIKDNGKPNSNTKFACWLKDNLPKGKTWDKLSKKDKLKYAQQFALDKKWREDNELSEKGIYEPYAKIFIKVGEVGTGGHREGVKIRINARKQAIRKGDEKYKPELLPKLQKQIDDIQEGKGKAQDKQTKIDKAVDKVYNEHLERGGEKSIYDKQKDGDSESLSQATNVKKTEQNTIDEVYRDTVQAMDDADKQWAKDNPIEAIEQGIPPKNGPNKQAYVDSVLEALHYNQLIDVEDDRDHKMIQQMGIIGARASHIRNCLAELSGYDMPPGDREGLKKHLRENCQVDANTGRISVNSPNGNKELMSDEFRTAGTSDKVDSKHGVDMRTCIINKVNEEGK